MKYLQRLLLLLTVSVAIFSCQKEYSVENSVGLNGSTAQWSFKEGGAEFKGPIDTVTIDTLNNYQLLTINGHSADKKDQIILQVYGTSLKPGTYKAPYNLFAYSRNGVVVYQSNPTVIDSFTIVITKLDSTGISGTFNGKAYDSLKASKTIVDGKFSAVLKSSTTVTPTTDSGNVVLWSKAGCGGGTSTSSINVKVSNKSGQITTFGAEPTTCDPAGTFSLKLPVGTYPWVAKCGTDSVAGTLTVTKGGCTKVQVDFTAVVAGDYFPITTNSNWSYLYEASTADDTVYVLSTGKTLPNAGGAYNIFTNAYSPTYKDSSYYKKASGLYYEYFPADTSSPAIEHIFLKDNVTAGTTWQSNYPGGTYQGVAFTSRISDTLSQKLTSYKVGATTYQDVLEVHTGYFLVFPAPIGLQQAYLIKQWFAKGVGLIKYYQNDYATGTGESTMDLTRSKVF